MKRRIPNHFTLCRTLLADADRLSPIDESLAQAVAESVFGFVSSIRHADGTTGFVDHRSGLSCCVGTIERVPAVRYFAPFRGRIEVYRGMRIRTAGEFKYVPPAREKQLEISLIDTK